MFGGDVYAILLSRRVNKLHASHSNECDWPPCLGWGLPLCHRAMARPDSLPFFPRLDLFLDQHGMLLGHFFGDEHCSMSGFPALC